MVLHTSLCRGSNGSLTSVSRWKSSTAVLVLGRQLYWCLPVSAAPWKMKNSVPGKADTFLVINWEISCLPGKWRHLPHKTNKLVFLAPKVGKIEKKKMKFNFSSIYQIWMWNWISLRSKAVLKFYAEVLPLSAKRTMMLVAWTGEQLELFQFIFGIECVNSWVTIRIY